MQATSTVIRQERTAQAIEEGMISFAARQAQVAILAEAILAEGQPELHKDSTAVCRHFKLRRGFLPADGGGMNACEAQLYRHAAGIVIRFWVYGEDFSVKVRDLIMLHTQEAKGFDTWLDTREDGDHGRLFPHTGKYLMPGFKILAHEILGR